MKSKLVLAVIVCLVVTADAQEYGRGESQRPREQVYALEGLGGLGGVAGCVGLAYGGALAYIAAFSIEGWSTLGVAAGAALVCAAAVPAAAAYGTISTGEALGEDGSNGGAFGGAYAGLPLAVGAFVLGAHVSDDGYGRRTSYWDIPLYVLGGLAIPVGAVVGYNLGNMGEAGTSQPGLGVRLQLPAVALTSTELPDHSVEYGVKVQLAGLRF